MKRTKKNAKSIFALMHALMMVGGASAQTNSTTATTPEKEADKKAKPAPTKSSTDTTSLPVVVVTAKEEKSSYQGEKVSSSKYTGPLRDTPQTVTVIPASIMKDQGVTTLRDALRNVPGISFQAGEGGVPAGDQMTIRGFSARTDIFVDGFRDVGGYTRDSFNVEQVEVIKGPNSSYSGRGSTGGGVNMTTKTPKMENFLNADLGYGTNEYYRTTVDANYKVPLDKIGSDIPAAFRLNGLFHTQEYAERDFVSDERWAIAPTFTLGLGTPTEATLGYFHLEEKNLPSYGLPFVTTTANPYGGASAVGQVAPVEYSTFFGLATRDYEDITNDALKLKLSHEFNDNIKLENQSQYGITRRDSVVTAPRIQANAVVANGSTPFGIRRELQSRDQIVENTANQTNLITKFKTAEMDHTLVSSAEYNYEHDVNYLRSSPTLFSIGTTAFQTPVGDPFNPDHFAPSSGPITRTGAKNEAYSDSIAVSVFDTIKITDQWILNLGARGDYFQTYLDQRAINTNVTVAERADLAPTWRTGLTYKPVPYGSIYFSYGTSFNPSLEGLTTSTSAISVAGLEPETSESYEVGTKWDFLKEKLSFSAALFRTIKENFRNQDGLLTTVISASGEVQVQGIEVGIAGNITDDWKVFGGYAIMESNINKSAAMTAYNGVNIPEVNHELSNTPEQTANMWTTYTLPFHLEIGTGINFIDKRFANNINTNSVDGYWLQDALISYKVNDHWDLRLNIQNLWGKEYIDRVGGGHAIPGSGRMVILSSSVKF